MPETTPSEPIVKPTAKWRIPLVIGAVLAGAVIGYVGVSGLRHPAGGDVACNSAVDLAKKIAPLAHGEVAALTMATNPLRLPGGIVSNHVTSVSEVAPPRGATCTQRWSGPIG